MRYIQLTFLILLALLLLLPVGFMVHGWDVELHGVEFREDAVLPTSTMEDVFNQSFQQRFAAWFDQEIGLRGVMVRTANQLNLSLFNEFHDTGGTGVTIGKDRQLFERGYIKGLNRFDHMSDADLVYLADLLLEVQQKLEREGKPFILIISPNKATVYPEDVPEQFILHHRASAPQNLERLMPLLEERGVHVVDSHSWFLAMKPMGIPLFGRGGSHWNYYGACMVTREALGSFTRQGLRLPELRCDPGTLKEEPLKRDRDLWEILNLWDQEYDFGGALHPEYAVSGRKTNYNALFIGSSFLWHVLDMLDGQGVYHQRDMYYYYKSNHEYPEGTRTEFSFTDETSWRGAVLAHDMVILEINESALQHTGFGFLQDAVKYLK